MQLKTTIDVSEAVAGLDELQKRQIPFALAKTLTGCVKVGQAAVREDMNGKFTLRNTFTQDGIRIKPAEKNGAVIEADVHTAPRISTYLERQEEGGMRIPINGRAHLAIPTDHLIQLAGGKDAIIPRELRPKALLEFEQSGKMRQSKRGKRIELKDTIRGWYFFSESHGVKLHPHGHYGIWGRYMNDTNIYPMYIFVNEAKIAPVLKMEDTVREAAMRAFAREWDETWSSIMAKGLRITS